MSPKYKVLCAAASVITVAGIVCMMVLEGERSKPTGTGLLLLVAGILFWMFILARLYSAVPGPWRACEQAAGMGQYRLPFLAFTVFLLHLRAARRGPS